MKGIILAGGTGSRLYPITKVTNKHLLPVGRYPMIYHAVYKLRESGITDIMVVTGKEHMGDIVSSLGSGAGFSVSFTYRVQEQAGGIAEALGLCEDFASGGRIVVVLGDNIFSASLVPYVEAYRRQETGAHILLKEVDNPTRFGVAEVEAGKVISIEEKPAQPRSRYAVTGVYMYDAHVFDFIRGLEPSRRGELEITDVNNAYIKQGTLQYSVLEGWWTDAGTHESLRRANVLAADVYLGEEFQR